MKRDYSSHPETRPPGCLKAFKNAPGVFVPLAFQSLWRDGDDLLDTFLRKNVPRRAGETGEIQHLIKRLKLLLVVIVVFDQ